jgi:glutamate-ammonia-ligase adenylyltransferase
MSVRDRAFLQAWSPAAARAIANRPSLQRFLERSPDPSVLARVPSSAGPRARRALRLLRVRTLVHTAALEGAGGSPLAAARVWTAFADAALALADRMALFEVERRFGPIAGEGEPVGRAVFALGKLGSRELNPSSDIDLLLAYERDVEVPTKDGARTSHELFTAWAQRLRKILADIDDDGFAFRVDYDLRPEGTQGPIVNSVDALESYYERFGQT